MSEDLPEEYLQLQKLARDFTNNEIVPIASELDRKDEHIPESIVRKMGDLGFYGILVPMEYGGAGMDHVALAIVTEELCKGCGICSSFCRREVFTTSDNISKRGYYLPAVVKMDKCAGCKQCQLMCPEFAITVCNT